MSGFLTRGQPAALRQVRAMIAAGMPHALLLVGPKSVGKTTLALDIAAALLCLDPDPAVRPCRACRGCRLVGDGNHPDVHRLAPEGPGLQIRIDAVRRLVSELALLPVEGGARLAILESAHRLNEDAQNALLKALEEPPSGVTIILCADDEDRLLPTIHSRVARVRLGTVAARDIEELLEARGEADAPTANRVARIADGRPGLAIAYARAVDAAPIRGELARSLLDLMAAPPSLRLGRIRELLSRAKDLRTALVAAETAAAGAEPARPRRRARGGSGADAAGAGAAGGNAAPAVADAGGGTGAGGANAAAADGEGDPAAGAVRSAAVDRRRDAALLLDIWRDVARDLVLVALGDPAGARDPDLLEELVARNARLAEGSVGSFLRRLDAASVALENNVSPELIADTLALAWPQVSRAA